MDEAKVDPVLHPKTPKALLDRLDKTGRFYIFVLSLTDRCNIRCDFCCHPYMDSEISDQDALRLVSEAVELDFEEIAMTGGEPLIRKQLVLDLAKICLQHNKLFGIITNGFWAKSVKKAQKWAREMRDAGVTRVTVSWDPSHGAFIAPQTAQNAVDACIEEGMKVTLTGSFKQKDDRHINYGIKTEHLERYKNFRHFEMRAAPAGDGAKLTDLNLVVNKELAEKDMRCPCCADLLELVLYARNGLTQPCCSVYAGYKMEPLRLGDWREMSVAELRDRQLGDPFFMILREHGFKRIYEIVKDCDPELFEQLPVYGDAMSTCHFCSKVMQGTLGERVRMVVNDYMDEKISSIFELVRGGELAAKYTGVRSHDP
jgi:hypothetical protein